MERAVLSEQMDRNLVYIKEIAAVDLPDELQAQIDHTNPMFSVHNAKGDQLALVGNRQLAFDLAYRNDLVPMALH